ncbi:MAG: PqqD family protein [Polyangiaceae bacterium]|nr:PqqD family protein [Polyangiaceae bacterium]
MKLKIAPNVFLRKFDLEAIVLDMRVGEYFSLNEVGVRVWSEIEKGNDLLASIEGLAAEYDAPKSQIETDVKALIEELKRRGLLLES